MFSMWVLTLSILMTMMKREHQLQSLAKIMLQELGLMKMFLWLQVLTFSLCLLH
uniref:Uncharacterized protein n=1 Tax=Arundo donax TaxID=35708 RepID=A0A0A8YLA8_ARUDO